MPRLHHAMLILIAAAAVLACAPAPAPSSAPAAPSAPALDDYLDLPADVEPVQFGWTRLTIETRGGPLELGVFIADTAERRQRGLMYASGLPPASAMLFRFEDPPVHAGFWNNNVPIDLEVAFLDAGGRIIEILTLEARSRETKRPEQPYSYALEMPAGRYAALGIQLGDRLLIDPEAAPQD